MLTITPHNIQSPLTELVLLQKQPWPLILVRTAALRTKPDFSRDVPSSPTHGDTLFDTLSFDPPRDSSWVPIPRVVCKAMPLL